MKRLFGVSVLGIGALTLSTTVLAQTPQTPPQPSSSGEITEEGTRPATTTTTGETGLWHVPTAKVLPAGRWSASFYRTNIDDGQGFTDISTWPATFGVGLGGRAEVFGSWALVTRIDRDIRPLFGDASNAEGTGGGIVPDYPKVREQWIGNKLGDLTLGAKVNFLPEAAPWAFAVRGAVKLPVGNDDDGASSGATDFSADAVVSGRNAVAEISGYGGIMMRGNPDGYDLTNGLRWGIGAAFPQRYNLGFKLTAELFGERYFDDVVTAPAGLVGADGSLVPTSSRVSGPVVAALGLTWQAPNGFFVGAAANWNLAMASREEVGGGNIFGDKADLLFRIGYHPGVRDRVVVNRVVAPPPPPTSGGPGAGGQTPPPPPVVQNRPPTVDALCDPCTVEVGRTATVTANAQDPDGDALTYQWKAGGGTLTSPSARQSPWTAPMQPGQVPFTVTVNDGRGGTASDTVNIQVTAPVQQSYSFEDVHFEFDRFTLRQDALKVLDQAISAMQQNATLRLEIEGHTCNIGTAEYNLALGERRAVAVRDYLVSRGIAATRLSTVSYGEERPKHDNSREETRRLNRRSSLIVRLQ